YVVNLEDPSSPKLVGNLRLKGYPNHVRVVGNHAFVSANQAPLQVVNVSDPTHPVLVGSFPTTGGSRMVEAAGSTAYLISNDGKLRILKISEDPIGFSLQPDDIQIQTGQTARF